MSKLNDGEVEITLNGTPRVLRPTLNAMQALSRGHGGLAGTRAAILNQEVDVYCNVLVHGMGLKEGDRRDLLKALYKNGMTTDLMVDLIRYVSILGNGGKPLDEKEGEDEDGDDSAPAAEGNF